jgi:hypothetical protein
MIELCYSMSSLRKKNQKEKSKIGIEHRNIKKCRSHSQSSMNISGNDEPIHITVNSKAIINT